ncbi:hypothetical protein Taro_034449, partial [Colocasia esculenta]|nr:hypothetical protein [Colocasia esculenta]
MGLLACHQYRQIQEDTDRHAQRILVVSLCPGGRKMLREPLYPKESFGGFNPELRPKLQGHSVNKELVISDPRNHSSKAVTWSRLHVKEQDANNFVAVLDAGLGQSLVRVLVKEGYDYRLVMEGSLHQMDYWYLS